MKVETIKTKHQINAYEIGRKALNIYEQNGIVINTGELLYFLENDMILNGYSSIENVNIEERDILAKLIFDNIKGDRDFREQEKVRKIRTKFLESCLDIKKFSKEIMSIASEVTNIFGIKDFALFQNKNLSELSAKDRETLSAVLQEDLVYKIASIIDHIIEKSYNNKHLKKFTIAIPSNLDLLKKVLIEQVHSVFRKTNIVDKKGVIDIDSFNAEIVELIVADSLQSLVRNCEIEREATFEKIRQREDALNKREAELEKREEEINKFANELTELSNKLKKYEETLNSKNDKIKLKQDELTSLMNNFKKAYSGIFVGEDLLKSADE